MAADWPALAYDEWRDTCDTLHAHTQVLGKLCVALAPLEPELQHAARMLTSRGWETRPLPAPNGSGALVAGLDLHSHESVAEHSGRAFGTSSADAGPARRGGHARADRGRPRARRRCANRPEAAGGRVDPPA